MYKQKLGFSMFGSYEYGMSSAVKLIKDCKFDVISPVWTNDYNIEEIANVRVTW